MWFASLLTSGAASFGRLLIVGLLPNAVPIVFTWLLLRAHSFSGHSDWSRLVPVNLTADLLAVLFAVLVITLLTVLVQPFQLRMVRLLEGYWEGWWLSARIAPFFVECQHRRQESLRNRIDHLGEEIGRLAAAEPETLQQHRHNQRKLATKRAAKERAKLTLQRYPRPADTGKPETPLLPTALGNALRTGETSAGERYGLNTIASWPRLYPLLSDKLATVHASARDSLDAAANLCIGFLLTAVIGIAALADEPKAYWIPALAVLTCCFCYVGAIAAAVTFTTYVRVAYDLHRFDLLKALHHELPETLTAEYDQLAQLSDFFLAESADQTSDGLAAATLPPRRCVHPDTTAES